MTEEISEEPHSSLAYKITLIEFGVLFLVVFIILMILLLCSLYVLYRLLLELFKSLRRRFRRSTRKYKLLDVSPSSPSKTSFLTSLPPPTTSRLSRCPKCPFHPPLTSLPCKHGWRPESKALRVVGNLPQSTRSLLNSQDVVDDILVTRSYSEPVR